MEEKLERDMSSDFSGKRREKRGEKRGAELEKSQLSESDIRLLLIVCAELVNFCAKVTGEINPAAAAMLAYVRDDIRFENTVQLP
jgi:hypothetical protein